MRLRAALLIVAAALVPAACVLDAKTKAELARGDAFSVYEEGLQYKADGNFVRARDKFLAAAAISPRPVFYYQVANCSYRLGQLEEATAYYQRSLDGAPDFALARSEYDLVRLQLRERELSAAARAQRLATAPPANVVAQLEPAYRPLAPERPQPAIDESDAAPSAIAPPAANEAPPSLEPASSAASASAANPETPKAPKAATEEFGFSGMRSAMTALQTKEGDDLLSGALESIDKERARAVLFPELSRPSPVDLEAERKSARDSERLGRWDDAVRRWNRVVEADSSDLAARLSYARALARTARTQRAFEEYETLIKGHADNPRVWFERGNFLVGRQEYPRAQESYERAIALAPRSPEYRNNLAALYLRTENHRAAETVLRDLNRDFPEYAPAWLNRALLEERTGNLAAALGALETYLRLDAPRSEIEERWLLKLRSQVPEGAAKP